MPHEQPHYRRDGKPKLEHEEDHQRDEMPQRGLRSNRLHAFLKGFQDDRRLLLHVGKGTARIVHDDLLHIRVKDIRIAKQGAQTSASNMKGMNIPFMKDSRRCLSKRVIRLPIRKASL